MRWLSKSRVMLGLCGLLLIASLNRQDAMIYGMFLFMTVVSVLGFVVPWMSLRSMTVHAALGSTDSAPVLEGQPCDLRLVIHRTSRWPALMVNIESRWQWASREIVLRQTVPVIRRGRTHDLGEQVSFPCRGQYRLMSVSLATGFPMGLIQVSQKMVPDECQLLVLPRQHLANWPQPWQLSEDPLGQMSTRRIGQSLDLGQLRQYQVGEPIGRVNWRASARIGELVIQHFQQSGSPLLRVVTEIPSADQVGIPDSSAEHALRFAAGLCQLALKQQVRLRAYMPVQQEPMSDQLAIECAMAAALPGSLALSAAILRSVNDMVPGDQLAIVVGWQYNAAALLSELSVPGLQGVPVVVCIATGPRPMPVVAELARELKRVVVQAGFAVELDLRP